MLRANGRSLVLHGSLAAGGFVPGRSDIDLLAVVDRGLTDARAGALVELVESATEDVDLHVLTTDAVREPGRAPAVELYVSRHDPAVRGRHDPDVIVELSMARQDGRAVWGGEPRDIIAPIPAGWVVDRGRYWLRRWLTLTDDAEHGPFMVLTACRIWHFAVEGRHAPKPRAAEWALRRDPEAVAVRQVLEGYAPDARGIANLLRTVLDSTEPRPDRPAGASGTDGDGAI